MKKAVLIYSGGLDSTVLLTKFVQEGYDVHALNFNYGSKHNWNEREAARKICSQLNVKLKEINMEFLGNLLKSDLLLSSDNEIPEGHYEAENMKSTVVPFRNGIMLSIAVGYADSICGEHESTNVYLASHVGDHAVYADCRPNFTMEMSQAAQSGTNNNIAIFAPFCTLTKIQIVELGQQIKAPLADTWSCYKGKKRPCLRCGTCVERTESFKNSCYGLPDFSLTKNEWIEALKILNETNKEKS